MALYGFIAAFLLSTMIWYFDVYRHHGSSAIVADGLTKGTNVMTEYQTQSPTIDVYTTATCPYCIKAKALLDKKGVPYHLIDVSFDDDLRSKMMERANGRRTVPQIFINDVHVGGFDDLSALDRDGKLDALLKGH